MTAHDRYDSLIQWYCHLAGLEGDRWLLLKAIIRRESIFNPEAKSPAGAVGLAQFMTRTFLEWWDMTPGIQALPAGVELPDRSNPEASIKAEAGYIGALLKHYQNEELALAAYNCGPGRLDKIRENSNATFEQIKLKLPEETQKYVPIIMNYYQMYRQEQHRLATEEVAHA